MLIRQRWWRRRRRSTHMTPHKRAIYAIKTLSTTHQIVLRATKPTDKKNNVQLNHRIIPCFHFKVHISLLFLLLYSCVVLIYCTTGSHILAFTKCICAWTDFLSFCKRLEAIVQRETKIICVFVWSGNDTIYPHRFPVPCVWYFRTAKPVRERKRVRDDD